MTLAELDALDDAAFRAHVRAWVEANTPPEIRFPPRRLHWRENRPWYLALSQQGWLAPAWPREFGGMGLSAARQLIMIEELERWGCPRVSDMGVLMLGPMLLKHGSEELTPMSRASASMFSRAPGGRSRSMMRASSRARTCCANPTRVSARASCIVHDLGVGTGRTQGTDPRWGSANVSAERAGVVRPWPPEFR